MLTFCNNFRLKGTNRSNNNTMKPKPNQTILILSGVVLAFLLSFGVSSTKNIKMEEGSIEIITNYKSTVPLIIAPLHILAKGLKLSND